jgi:hypothetical protein
MTAIAVLLDGHTVSAYSQPFERGGRVFAPVHPFVTGVADRIEYRGSTIVIHRDGHSLELAVAARAADGGVYVPLAYVMRALGEMVTYDGRHHRMEITTPDAIEIATPAPFDPTTQQASPREVFTPRPIPTPVPVWTGRPLPRRTPLPYRSPLRNRS